MLKKLVRWLVPEIWILKIRGLVAPNCKKGRGTYIAPGVQLLGAKNISIGVNSCISEETWLNVNHRVNNEIAIDIGDNCFIGRQNFFSSGKKITIGHYVLSTIGCKFICSSHIISNPLIPYIATGTTSTDEIRIGANCFFGAGSSVIGNVSIGHGSVIGAGALVTKNVPPFSIVIGSPFTIVKRYSFSKRTWIDSSEISDSDLSDNPDEASYLQQLRTSHRTVPMPLLAASSSFGNI